MTIAKPDSATPQLGQGDTQYGNGSRSLSGRIAMGPHCGFSSIYEHPAAIVSLIFPVTHTFMAIG
jgi:hypothetical protein